MAGGLALTVSAIKSGDWVDLDSMRATRRQVGIFENWKLPKLSLACAIESKVSLKLLSLDPLFSWVMIKKQPFTDVADRRHGLSKRCTI